MKKNSRRIVRAKLKVALLHDGCIGCGDEPAAKGTLGKQCKSYRYYHDAQSNGELERYIGKVNKASRRIGSLLIGAGRRQHGMKLVHKR